MFLFEIGGQFSFIYLLICLFQTKRLRFISHRFLFPEEQPPLLVDYPISLKEIAFPGKEERRGEGEEGELVSLFCLPFLPFSNTKTLKWCSECSVTSETAECSS